jgi:glutamyl/glutaminyl-tRNA synthetase
VVRVRFAPSPTGSLHLGNALSAVAGRRFADENGGVLLLRTAQSGNEAALADLDWLGVEWDEGPVSESERFVRHREASHLIGEPDPDGELRFGGTTVLRADGTPTERLAAAVDDLDFGVTHVLRPSDDRADESVEASLIRALGGTPPDSVHHGTLRGDDGMSSLADLCDAGYPAESVRAYLEELGLPRDDVHLDLARLRRLSIEALAALSDDELAARVGVPVSVVPVMRGARDLREARAYAEQILAPEHVEVDSPETLGRMRELVDGGLDARGIVRELQAVGGDLRAVRLALTGRDRGPELAAVIESLSRRELLQRISAS